MTALGIMIGLLAAFVLLMSLVSMYNHLVLVKHNVERAFADIAVLLRQRHQELPKLVEVCKQYSAFEQGLLERLTQARAEVARSLDAGSIGALARAERSLRAELGRLFAVAEAYPALRAHEQFAHLQSRISALETAIADRRVFYNETVRINNVAIRRFPAVLMAMACGFRHAQLLQFDARQTADVELGRSFAS